MNWFTDCLPGFYGIKCKQHCSGHCLDNLACNHFDGTCSNGCEAGYVENICNTCKILNFPSFHIFGYLLHISIWKTRLEGFFMPYATFMNCVIYRYSFEKDSMIYSHRHMYVWFTACRYGYYGKNCSSVCSPNCRTCNHTDGICTCYAGWSRPDCTNGILIKKSQQNLISDMNMLFINLSIVWWHMCCRYF